jgi:hypothetical protein
VTAVLRPELPTPIPQRILRLPIHRGYPVPWFVTWVNEKDEPQPRGQGTPEFRVITRHVIAEAHGRSLCWICGGPLGRYRTFVIGPMCAVNRTSAEPPGHRECGDWSARACPFLSRPHARRREAGLPEEAVSPGGIMLRRNPGVSLVWTTERYRLRHDPNGGILFNIGDPHAVAWYCEGRPASYDEVWASIESGLPNLRELCDTPAAHAALDAYIERALPLLPTRTEKEEVHA